MVVLQRSYSSDTRRISACSRLDWLRQKRLLTRVQVYRRSANGNRRGGTRKGCVVVCVESESGLMSLRGCQCPYTCCAQSECRIVAGAEHVRGFDKCACYSGKLGIIRPAVEDGENCIKGLETRVSASDTRSLGELAR